MSIDQGEFNLFLRQLSSENNEERINAESVHIELLETNCMEIIKSHIFNINSRNQFRLQSAVLLSRELTLLSNKLIENSNNEFSEWMFTEILKWIENPEFEPVLIGILSHLISKTALIFKNSGPWASLKDTLTLMAFQDNSNTSCFAIECISMCINNGVFDIFDAPEHYIGIVDHVFRLSKNENLLISASILFYSVADTLNNLQQLSGFLPKLIEIMNAISSQNITMFLSSFSVFFENYPNFFGPVIGELLIICLNIAENNEYDSSSRNISIFIANALFNYFSEELLEQAIPFVGKMIQIMFEGLERAEIFDNLELDGSPQKSAQDAIENISEVFGENVDYSSDLLQIIEELFTEDIYKQNISLQLLGIVYEPCVNIFYVGISDVILPMLWRAFTSEHDFIRYSAFNAFIKINSSYDEVFEGMQIYSIFQDFLKIILSETNPIVLKAELSAFAQLCEDSGYLPSDNIPSIIDALFSILDNTEQSHQVYIIRSIGKIANKNPKGIASYLKNIAENFLAIINDFFENYERELVFEVLNSSMFLFPLVINDESNLIINTVISFISKLNYDDLIDNERETILSIINSFTKCDPLPPYVEENLRFIIEICITVSSKGLSYREEAYNFNISELLVGEIICQSKKENLSRIYKESQFFEISQSLRSLEKLLQTKTPILKDFLLKIYDITKYWLSIHIKNSVEDLVIMNALSLSVHFIPLLDFKNSEESDYFLTIYSLAKSAISKLNSHEYIIPCSKSLYVLIFVFQNHFNRPDHDLMNTIVYMVNEANQRDIKARNQQSYRDTSSYMSEEQEVVFFLLESLYPMVLSHSELCTYLIPLMTLFDGNYNHYGSYIFFPILIISENYIDSDLAYDFILHCLKLLESSSYTQRFYALRALTKLLLHQKINSDIIPHLADAVSQIFNGVPKTNLFSLPYVRTCLLLFISIIPDNEKLQQTLFSNYSETSIDSEDEMLTVPILDNILQHKPDDQRLIKTISNIQQYNHYLN